MPPFVVPLLPFYASYAVMSFLYERWGFATDRDREALRARFADADEGDVEALLDREIDGLRRRAGARGISRLREQVEEMHEQRQTGDRFDEICAHLLREPDAEIREAFDALDAEYQERFRRHVLAMDAHAYVVLKAIDGDD